ncbi:class I SAM-dependent DNA methyltransferase [Granulicella arctica]|uniref:site-specific DNA-methyltransferase (adenine-specific) n=1 Tax=Granulicella arctica TaxID=940613 RepID=A0A7Y9TGT0_9BACT|nr:class I SAM-dependent DNA methyltransferase [Granulicella arctica]NYF79824.1 hypothetical protein [Granulicella arctica]
MNAVEIEEAISQLAEQPFDAANFPYAFLEAFGNKEATIKRLRAGATNKSDLGGVLQTGNIHIATCDQGSVTETLRELKDSPATAKAKAKFVLATDSVDFEAEDIASGETVACAYPDFPNHFGFFLQLAGITTVQQIKENSFDIRATSRMNRLYVELLKDNPEWGKSERRHDMNHFMARLIFCFFAEDTDIFIGKGLFTSTIAQMSERDSSNTHEIISALFRAMNTKVGERKSAGLPNWADSFPYVNGGLFSGNMDVPRFSKIARSYLLHIGGLDWTKINPDIFGSMIQAVTEDEERGALGMHYTSVPNILKVLNPLFLDDLRSKLEEAGDNPRALLNLRKRMAKIRVFDPACGSGNFLVIAYKQMREIEAEINRRRGEAEIRSEIPLTNFRGIELRDFPAEIARLALVIAEYQSDVHFRGQKLALAEFLPLRAENWITSGNALRLDWLSVCPPTGTGVRMQADDLFSTPLDQAEIDFANEGGETYICGNPPFSGFNAQSPEQHSDLRQALTFTKDYKYFDYVSGWFFKAARCMDVFDACAFVSTNSVVQGVQVPILWRPIFALGVEIFFGHDTFVWKNNAANNAGVFCVIIGLTKQKKEKFICGEGFRKRASNINGYIADAPNVFVDRRQEPISKLPPMTTGNVAYDGGHLIISELEREQYLRISPNLASVIRPLTGSKEFIRGEYRHCIWIPREELLTKEVSKVFAERFNLVRSTRVNGGKIASNYAHVPYRFYMTNESLGNQILVPRVSSVRRAYLPIAFLDNRYIISDSAQSIFDAPLWVFALLASKMHLVWVNAVSGKLKGDLRYSAIICYNTFAVPVLTEKNKADLTRCAEDILLARDVHFPATIAELYDPGNTPEDLLHAHERNDEVLERIYIGRRFKNDTERLAKLFDLYTKMSESATPAKRGKVKSDS